MRREQRTTTKSNPIAGRPSPCSSPRTVATTTRADKHLIAPGSLAGPVVQALRHIGLARAAELAQIAAPHLSPNDKKTLDRFVNSIENVPWRAVCPARKSFYFL